MLGRLSRDKRKKKTKETEKGNLKLMHTQFSFELKNEVIRTQQQQQQLQLALTLSKQNKKFCQDKEGRKMKSKTKL